MLHLEPAATKLVLFQSRVKSKMQNFGIQEDKGVSAGSKSCPPMKLGKTRTGFELIGDKLAVIL